MTCHIAKRASAVAFAAMTLLVSPCSLEASQRPAQPPAPVLVAQPAPQTQPPVTISQPDARQTRDDLNTLLEKCPPSLGRVLKLDPTLISNQSYLSAYPEVLAFIAGHPEIARDPRFFLAEISVPNDSKPDPKTEAVALWREMIEGVAVFLVFMVITSALVWLIRSLIEYRRWHQQSKMQIEVNNKLLDRFASNEDLLAYVQSAAGRRLLENASTGLDLTPRDVGSPIRRVLWAIQAGLVLAAGGSGIVFVSSRVIEEMRQPLFALGAVVLFLGAGFLLSAVASYGLTKRLGLLEALRNGGEGRRPAAPGA